MIVTPADDKGLDKVLKLIKMAPEELKLDIDWSSLGGPRRDSAARDKPEGRGSSRGRAPRAERPSEDVGAAEAAVAAPEPVIAAASTDEAPARRTRSRRTRGGDKPAAEAVVEAVAAPEPAPVAEARPAREPRLRQADRPGASKDRELPPAREGSGFGADIPAFLRRPVPVRA
jgi:hypothetical protein